MRTESSGRTERLTSPSVAIPSSKDPANRLARERPQAPPSGQSAYPHGSWPFPYPILAVCRIGYEWVLYRIPMDPLSNLAISPVILRLIASLDEFKGRWQAIGRLAPDRLSALRRVATIESVGSSTRIEGARLTDAEVDRLLSRIDVRSFRSRDEQEVAGYAEAMDSSSSPGES